MKPILEIENIGKKYLINQSGEPYLSLRDSLKNPFKRKTKETFWALKDVNFQVDAGESIGIIGKNGAGKSTLLKILSRITPPTSGKIISRGRIASLLEVGTGFHAELTGRENVFMNGSILGMRRKEIQRNFDAIVDFAGIEKFIDTPLKHYSSGMQLRLAFAVAAFLENEILIIDEVLAVGDAEFQKKCMGKMSDVAKSGRTVLFVSHNMAAINTLCEKSLFLSKGQVHSFGPTHEVLRNYRNSNEFERTEIRENPGVFNISEHGQKTYKSHSGMQKVSLFCDNIPGETVRSGGELKFEIEINGDASPQNPIFGFVVKNDEGIPLIGINNKHLGISLTKENKESTSVFTCVIPSFPLYDDGYYTVDLYWGENEDVYDIIPEAFGFNVECSDIYNSAHILDRNLNKVIISDIQFNLK